DDADEVLAAAYDGGLERLLVPAWDLDSTRRGLDLVRRLGLSTSAGVHPHVASDADDATWRVVREFSAEPEVVAIGETGLDYDRGFSPRTDQLSNLRRHIALAFETAKPLIIHCRSRPGLRDAQDDLIVELRQARVGERQWRDRFSGRPPGVLHSFSGPVDYAEAALEMDLAVSFSGLVFRAGEETSARVAALVPADRLLVETDSPYLKPRGIRGRWNTPRNVGVTAAWVCGLRGDDPGSFGAALVATFDRFVDADGPS
ncbi:MAG: TatD family hydrolase, partial [Chloroflexota bacterium]